MNTKWYRFKRTTFTKRQQIRNNVFVSLIIRLRAND